MIVTDITTTGGDPGFTAHAGATFGGLAAAFVVLPAARIATSLHTSEYGKGYALFEVAGTAQGDLLAVRERVRDGAPVHPDPWFEASIAAGLKRAGLPSRGARMADDPTRNPADNPMIVEFFPDDGEPGFLGRPGITFGELAVAFAAMPSDAVATILDTDGDYFTVIGTRPENLISTRDNMAAQIIVEPGGMAWFFNSISTALARFQRRGDLAA